MVVFSTQTLAMAVRAVVASLTEATLVLVLRGKVIMVALLAVLPIRVAAGARELLVDCM
jgi:hypothetical protein